VDLGSTGGTTSSVWRTADGTPDDCGLRWESSGNLGTAGTAFWGGQRSRLVSMYFEWSGIDNASSPSSAIRSDILGKTLTWLLGRAKPTATIAAPNGGEVITANSTDISWSESVAGGFSVAGRSLEYSLDGGASWTTITTSPGASPYSWDVTSVPNSPLAKLRLRVTDSGTPGLTASDVSDAVFTLQRSGGDAVGPAVVAGSIGTSPNPVDNQAAATLGATVTDVNSGGGNVAAAEWSMGASPAAAGSGTTMGGAFGTPTVLASAALNTSGFPTGMHKFWVRGQDADGNWGQARAFDVLVIGNDAVGVGGERATVFELRPTAPNPVFDRATLTFAAPQPAVVEVGIFDVMGRRVKDLVRGSVPAGVHRVQWDRRDQSGTRVAPGIYYARYVAGGKSFERTIVAIR
jgi:hypothetical protein